ncbi:MAG: DMT family transporter [Gammaproteobacteria bacterium]|nr:MAG: DMT family transporter [Gammaproteobacteria bacterium]
MNWGEFFALSSALIWAVAVILLRRSGETLPPFELNLFKNCVGFVLMIPTVLLFHGLVLPDYSLFEVFVIVTSGLLGIALADTWYLRALNLMGASRTGIVASFFSPFVILLSTVFLGERMVVWQWLGFSMVVLGVLLVTWRVHRSEVDTGDLRKGAIYGVAAMFMMAVGIVMVKEILETRPFLWTVELRLAGGVAGMLAVVVLKRRWQRVRQSFGQPQPWGTVITASFLASYLSLIMWLAGYKLIDASVASVLNETNGAFIVLLAWLMLGEKMSRRKLAGISLTLGGVIVMMSMK